MSLRFPSRKDPSRLSSEALGTALQGFDGDRIYVEEREKLWISPEPRMPRIFVSFVPASWARALRLIDPFADASPLSCTWSAESLLDASVPNFTPGGDPIGDGARALVYGFKLEMIGCTAVVRYELHERADRSGATYLRVQLQAEPSMVIPTNTISASFEFSDEQGRPIIRGGELQMVAHLRHLFLAPKIANIRIKIRGENPAKSAVRACLEEQGRRQGVFAREPAIAAHDRNALLALAYQESQFRQFYRASDKDFGIYLRWLHKNGVKMSAQDAVGLPVVGTSASAQHPLHGGFGVMQLDNPAPTAEQIWNWRANVEAGVKLYKKCVDAGLARLALLWGRYRDRGARWFRQDELYFESWVRYNSGNQFGYWGYWDELAGVWKPGGPGSYKADYANKVAYWYYLIEKGEADELADWD